MLSPSAAILTITRTGPDSCCSRLCKYQGVKGAAGGQSRKKSLLLPAADIDGCNMRVISCRITRLVMGTGLLRLLHSGLYAAVCLSVEWSSRRVHT